MKPRTWPDFPDARRELFQRLRSDEGERLALQENFFVETILPKSMIRPLRREEMDAYRRPFPNPRSRLPTLIFPRELPIEGEPADVVQAVERYGAWLASSAIPKLFVSAEPGSLLIGQAREFCRGWPNQTEISVDGVHFVQEDAANEIGSALREFLHTL